MEFPSNFSFFKHKNKVNIVFIFPEIIKVAEETNFSIFAHIMDLKEIIKHSLEISKSIIILLPKFTDLCEIPTLFCEQIQNLDL